MTNPSGSLRGVTLVEVVVMAAIVGVLAGMLMPAFARAKEKHRRAVCTNSLTQISRALSAYESETHSRPPWLSCLYSDYLRDSAVLVCPADRSFGRHGCVPDRAPFTDVGAAQFAEADDTIRSKAREEVRGTRNPDIASCSYLYDFNLAASSWWTGGVYPDQNADGIVSWREIREEVDMKGLQPDGTHSPAEAYGGSVPIVRCFQHVVKRFDSSATVLNLGVEDHNVYVSGPFKDDWKACRERRQP